MSDGIFDFFHPDQHSLNDTLLVLNKAFEKLDFHMLGVVNNSRRVVLLADGLSILLAKQLIKSKYSFSHVVCFTTIPDCVNSMFTSTHNVHHKHILNTFKFINRVRIPTTTGIAFRKLRTPYNTYLFPAIRGISSNNIQQKSKKGTSYKQQILDWVLFMNTTYPHLFVTEQIPYLPNTQYFFQLCTHMSDSCIEKEHSIKQILQSIEQQTTSSLMVHTTDKWTIQNQRHESNMCIVRMCKWFVRSNKTKVQEYIDVNNIVLKHDSLYSSQLTRHRVVLYPPTANIDTNNNESSLVSTTSLPEQTLHWLFQYCPVTVNKVILQKLKVLSQTQDVKSILVLRHTLQVPTLITGYPIFTMNIHSHTCQLLSICISTFNEHTGILTPWLTEYEYNIIETDILHTVQILLPFTHNTIHKDTVFIVTMSQYRSFWQSLHEWVTDTTEHVKLSNLCVNLPIEKISKKN